MFKPVWPKITSERPSERCWVRLLGEHDQPLRYVCVLAPELDDFYHRGRVLVEAYDNIETNPVNGTSKYGPLVFLTLDPDYAREIAQALIEMAGHADTLRVFDAITGDKETLMGG